MIMREPHKSDFLRIQHETLRDDRVSITARGILAYMLTMSDDWAFSINGLATALKLNKETVVKYIKELQAAGYVEIGDNRSKAGKFTGKAWTVYEIPQDHIQKNRNTEKPNTATVYGKTETRKNRNTEKPTVKNYQIKELSNIRTIKESTTPRTRAREYFIPPTLEDVTAYCLERKNNVDPQRWLDHYTSNGWRVGKNPMKDWKAAVRTWERSGYDDAPRRPAQHPPEPEGESVIDRITRLALENAERAEGGAV